MQEGNAEKRENGGDMGGFAVCHIFTVRAAHLSATVSYLCIWLSLAGFPPEFGQR
jgi:hypothetical protein